MYRLRDLDRRQMVVAALLVLVVLVHVGASIRQAIDVEWLPSGDDALIGLRTHDVFTSDRPLVGQPSTSHLYGPEQGTSHPGPIEFYWLAAPLRAFGPSVGMIGGIAVVSAASVLVAGWVVLRRAGPAVGAWAMVLLSALLWSEGTAIITDPISSNAGALPLVALAALAWAIADGDYRLLPLSALFGSWVAQQHLAIVAPAAAMVGLAAAGVVGEGIRRWRHRPPAPEVSEDGADDATSDGATPPEPVDGDPHDDGAAPAEGRLWPWVAGALAVAAVCWSTVAWQQITGDPGNITAVVEYARTSENPSVGWAGAYRQVVRSITVPPLLVRTDLTGLDFIQGPVSIGQQLVALLSLAGLVATAAVQWARRRTLALLATTALVLFVGGFYNGSSIPESIEAFRINFYRWNFVAAWLTWITLGWMVAIGAQWVADRRGQALPRALPVVGASLAVVLALVPAIATATTDGYADERRDEAGFGVMRTMSAAALDRADGAGRVTLVLRGRSAVLASGSAMALQLEHAGHSVVLPEQEARFWGEQRILEPGDDPGDLILVLASGRGSVPDGPGETIASVDMNADLRALLGPLTDQLEGSEIVIADDGDDLILERFTPAQLDYVRSLLAAVGPDPESVLTDPNLLAILQDGYLDSPQLDPEALAELADLLPATTVNDDDVFELRVLTRSELAEVVPSWSDG